MTNRFFLRPLSLGLGILLLVGAAGVLFWPQALPVEIKELLPGPFEERLRVDGRILGREKHTVTAFAGGDLRTVTLRVGDPVRKGQVVAQLFWDQEKALTSPVDGVVSRLFRDTAGPIARGEPILELVDTAHLEVSADLLTPDAARVRPGMALRVEGWGEEVPLTARVSQVSRAGFTKISALGVEEERTEIRGDFVSVSPIILARLGDHYHVDVTVVLSTETSALAVPLGALFRDGSTSAVYRVDNGRAILTPVTLGRENEEEALVLGGLQPGDSVILYPGDHIKNGIRVKPE